MPQLTYYRSFPGQVDVETCYYWSEGEIDPVLWKKCQITGK